MAYSDAQTAAPPEPPSLTRESGVVCERLDRVLSRVSKIGDRLHGAVPRDASAKGQEIRPEPNIRRNIDDAHNIISHIENEVTRIEDRL